MYGNPIVVVGSNRSGTKWLSNELSRHPDIASVRNERTGIRESVLLGGLADAFKWKTSADDYVGMIELWAASDLFVRTGVDKSLFYCIDQNVQEPVGLFSLLMATYASSVGCKYWLQKASPRVALQFEECVPGVRFVAVTREPLGQIRSRMANSRRRLAGASIFRAAFSYVRDQKLLRALIARYSCPVVSFEALAADKDAAIHRVFQELEIPLAALEEAAYFPNTSFAGGERERASYFGRPQELTMRFSIFFARLCPLSILDLISARVTREGPTVIPGGFANVIEQYHGQGMSQRSTQPDRRRVP